MKTKRTLFAITCKGSFISLWGDGWGWLCFRDDRLLYEMERIVFKTDTFSNVPQTNVTSNKETFKCIPSIVSFSELFTWYIDGTFLFCHGLNLVNASSTFLSSFNYFGRTKKSREMCCLQLIITKIATNVLYNDLLWMEMKWKRLICLLSTSQIHLRNETLYSCLWNMYGLCEALFQSWFIVKSRRREKHCEFLSGSFLGLFM